VVTVAKSSDNYKKYVNYDVKDKKIGAIMIDGTVNFNVS